MKKILLGVAATLLGSFLAVAPAQSGTVVEYYNATLDHYFVTNHGPEIQALDSGTLKGWARTGLTFQTYATGSTMFASSSPVCRFYGSPAYGLDSHFYSASPLECEDVKKKFPNEWLLEAEELFRVHPVNVNTGICPTGTKAVYRLWNNRPDVNHRYTTDAAVVDAMRAKGYILEGNGSPARPVAFCAADVAAPPPPAGAPVCTISKSTQFAVIGTPVTLTANCTGNPTSYAWINCTGAGGKCTVNATAPGTVNYAVLATNSVGTGAQASISLNWQVAASAAPVCQISANTTTPQLGTPLVLTSNCSQAPASYQWLGCSALIVDVCNLLSECSSSSQTCSPIGTQAGSVYYALRASNSAGESSKVGVTVDWRSGVTQPPPPPVGNLPVCQIQVSNNSPAVGSNLTLTAFCTSSPTSYEWTGSGCSSTTTNTCTTTETTAVRRPYSVAGRNADGLGSPATVVIDWQQPGPPVCTVTASSEYPTLGSSVRLTANCSQSPTSFVWTGCSSASSTCDATSSTAGPATYTVTATNAYGSGQGSKLVNWGTAPPVGSDFCSQYTNVVRATLPWGGYLDTHQNGGFPAGGVFVGVLTVPSNYTGTGANVGFVEFIDGQARRIMSVSPSACDFRTFVPGQPPRLSSDPSGATAPMAWDLGTNPETTVPLVPGRTYYVNVRNVDFYTGAISCTTANCNIRMTVNPR
jgi:hypothetical protein